MQIPSLCCIKHGGSSGGVRRGQLGSLNTVARGHHRSIHSSAAAGAHSVPLHTAAPAVYGFACQPLFSHPISMYVSLKFDMKARKCEPQKAVKLGNAAEWCKSATGADLQLNQRCDVTHLLKPKH